MLSSCQCGLALNFKVLGTRRFQPSGLVGPAHPPGMGPDSRSGFLGLPNWVLDICMAFGRPQRSWVQELKPLSPARFLLVVKAGGRSPGRSWDLTAQRLTDACRIHVVIRRHRPFWVCRLRICYMGTRRFHNHGFVCGLILEAFASGVHSWAQYFQESSSVHTMQSVY